MFDISQRICDRHFRAFACDANENRFMREKADAEAQMQRDYCIMSVVSAV